MAHLVKATDGGPAANTRGITARVPARSDSGSELESANGIVAGDDGKTQDPQQQQLDEPDVDAATDDAATARVTIASMMKQMEAMSKKMARMEQQLHQQQQSSFSLDSSSSSSSQHQPSSTNSMNDVATLVRALQIGQTQQSEQLRKQQAASTAQMLILQSLGELPTFSGKGGDTTLIAHEWLQRCDSFFAIREEALGIDAAAGDQSRRLNAAYALQDDARRWYNALPQQPSTWTGFSSAIKARFCSVPSERIRVDKLREFVEKASKLRDKLNVQGMQAFTARFAQLAGEVPDEYVTQHGKIALLARGLPQRYAEVVLKEDAKKPLPPLHEIINIVLSRASHKEQAASYGGASAASGSAAPTNLDAVSLAVATFGWTREEAQQHFHEDEGWAQHDTHGNPPSHSNSNSSSVASSSPTQMSYQQMEQILNALGRMGTMGDTDSGDRKRSTNRGSGVTKEVPAELARARQHAGLCIKCGIVNYERGGHDAATCPAQADKTTSIADGLKQANS